MSREDAHVVLPNGWCFHYKDDGHSYWECSKDPHHRAKMPRFPGASSLGKPMDTDPQYLLRWAARQDHAGIAQSLTHLPGDAIIWLMTDVASDAQAAWTIR